MTGQLEQTEIVDGAPVKYVRRKLNQEVVETVVKDGKLVRTGRTLYKAFWGRVAVRAKRRVCEVCGQEFWAWPDSFQALCANCAWESGGGKSYD